MSDFMRQFLVVFVKIVFGNRGVRLTESGRVLDANDVLVQERMLFEIALGSTIVKRVVPDAGCYIQRIDGLSTRIEPGMVGRDIV